MPTGRKSKKKRLSAQAKKSARQQKKIARLEKRIRRLRQDLRQARKYHRPRRQIRAKLTRALKVRRISERPIKPQRPERFKRIERFKAEKGGTRKLPQIKRRRRGKPKRRARKVYRTRPVFVETVVSTNYPDATGEFIRLTAPLSYRDWLHKLKGLKFDPKIKKLIKNGYKLIYKIGDNLDGTHQTIETLIAHFNERYVAPNRKYPHGRIPSMKKHQRDQFFEILTIYAVKRFHKGKRIKHRKVNKTGRSI